MTKSLWKLLIVDDDSTLVSVLSESLAQYGFKCTCAENSSSALRMIGTYRFDALLIDFLPRAETASVVKAFLGEHPDAPVILLTGDASQEVKEVAAASGVVLVLEKPITGPELASGLKDLLRGDLESQTG